MSCYFRQMKEVLAEAGIVVTPANRKAVDTAFHRVAGLQTKHCPTAWKALKPRLATEEEVRALARELQEAMRQGPTAPA
jgi:hypothetical protein